MRTTILKFSLVSPQLYDTVTFIDLILIDFQDVTYATALMPLTADPWQHWLQDLQWPRFYCRESDPSNSSAPTFPTMPRDGKQTNASVIM